MPDVNRGDRPLSPFMIGPYYRPQWTSMSSILVRITGIACLVLSVIIVAWLLASATSESAFATINGLLTSFLGKIVLLGGVWALTYHMLGRLRHVIWDFGYWIEIDIAERMAKGMVAGATLASVVAAVLMFS